MLLVLIVIFGLMLGLKGLLSVIGVLLWLVSLMLIFLVVGLFVLRVSMLVIGVLLVEVLLSII